MKAILLGKEHDITGFASDDPSRYILQSVHYRPQDKLIEATNGRVLVRVPVIESEEFPPVKGQTEDPPVEATIPVAPFQKALKNIPKTNLAILEHFKLESNGSITFRTTDLDVEQAVVCRPIEGQYPKTDQVWPEQKDYPVVFALAGIQLKKVVEYACKHGLTDDCTIKFSVKDELTPVLFSIAIKSNGEPAEAKGVLMPMRLT